MWCDLENMKLSELKEKIYWINNIITGKQEKFINDLAAPHGVKLKNNALVSRQEAQYIIPNLQNGNISIFEKFKDRFCTFV